MKWIKHLERGCNAVRETRKRLLKVIVDYKWLDMIWQHLVVMELVRRVRNLGFHKARQQIMEGVIRLAISFWETGGGNLASLLRRFKLWKRRIVKNSELFKSHLSRKWKLRYYECLRWSSQLSSSGAPRIPFPWPIDPKVNEVHKNYWAGQYIGLFHVLWNIILFSRTSLETEVSD